MTHDKKNSIKIGKFLPDSQGILHGKIFGLGMGTTSVLLEPRASKEGRPYFRIIADPAKEPFAIGVAFPKEKDGLVFYSFSIDSPALPHPINAALFADKSGAGYNLVWNRSEESKAPKPEQGFGLPQAHNQSSIKSAFTPYPV